METTPQRDGWRKVQRLQQVQSGCPYGLSVPGNVRPKAKCKEKAPSAPRRARTGPCAGGLPPPPSTRALTAKPGRPESPEPSNTPARGPRAPTRDVRRAPRPSPEAGLQQSRALPATPRTHLLTAPGQQQPRAGGPCAPAPATAAGPGRACPGKLLPAGLAQDPRAGRPAPPDSEVGGGAFPRLHSQKLGSFWTVRSAGSK